MELLKERTRLLITEYTDGEKRHLEDMVASMDNVFMYQDPDSGVLGLEPGITNSIRRIFPYAKFRDNSDEYWDYDKIQPVEHNAAPRNQLQRDFIEFVLQNAKKKQKLAGILGCGQGKAITNSTLIPTINGPLAIGEIQVGETIFGSNGRPTKVIGVFPQGEKEIYKITFSDGRYSLASLDHLWSVTTEWDPKTRVMSTEELIRNYKQINPNRLKNKNRDPYRYIYRIPLITSPAEYPHRDVKVDPYIMGAFIGNGCMTEKHLCLSSGNEFVPNKIASILKCKTRKDRCNYNYCFYVFEHTRIRRDEVFSAYPEVCGYSRDKVIPEDYIYNDLPTRMELLRGLMDTDGSISFAEGRYNVSFSSCSKKLLEQIRQIILSLGFIANISSPDKRTEKYVNGYCSQVNIRVPNAFKQHLFTVPGKRDLALRAATMPDKHQYYKYLIIKKIEYYGKEEATCLAVDAEDHLFCSEDFVVTHNTFMACYSAIAVGQKTLFIVPTSSIKQQWVDTLIKMFNVPEDRVCNVRGPKDFIYRAPKSDFVVVSHASLASLNKTYDLEKLMKRCKFGIKVIDEVQMWFKNIITVDANCNIANNWYLTGTFGRSGETENKIYQEMFGDLEIFREKEKTPTVFNKRPGNIYGQKPYINVTMVWTKSGLSKEEIKKVTNSMRYSEREGKWVRFGISVPAYMELLFPEDGTMTPYIKTVLKVVAKAEMQVRYGKSLILGSTISSAEILAKYLRRMFPNKKIGTYHSRNSKEENARNKAECDMIVTTTSSAGTGFDWKGLSKVILYAPMRSWILCQQVAFRNRRRDDGKDCYHWDIVDSQIPQLRAWANVRADVYKRIGKSFKVIDM